MGKAASRTRWWTSIRVALSGLRRRRGRRPRIVQLVRERPQVVKEIVLDVGRDKHVGLPDHPVLRQLADCGLEVRGGYCDEDAW